MNIWCICIYYIYVWVSCLQESRYLQRKFGSQKMHKTDGCTHFLFFTCQRAHYEHQPVGQAFRVIPRLLVVQVRIQAAIRAAQHKTHAHMLAPRASHVLDARGMSREQFIPANKGNKIALARRTNQLCRKPTKPSRTFIESIIGKLLHGYRESFCISENTHRDLAYLLSSRIP